MLYILEGHASGKEKYIDPNVNYVTYHASLEDAVNNIDSMLSTLLSKYEYEYNGGEKADFDWFKSRCSEYYDIDISIIEMHNSDMLDINKSKAVLDKYGVVNPGLQSGSSHLSSVDIKNMWDEMLAYVTYTYDINGNQLGRYEFTMALEACYRPYESMKYKVGDMVETKYGTGIISAMPPDKYSYVEWSLSYEVYIDNDYYNIPQNEIKLVKEE